MRHMLGNLSPNYFERTKRYMMLRASQQGTDLTVSGTPPLSLPNSLGKPLKAWEVDVLPKQDLNGYDAPWPEGGGKNKCPEAWVNKAGYWYNKRDDNTRLGLSELIKVTPSATYTISRNSGTLRYAIQQYANTDESVDTNPCINDTSWISNSSYTLTMSATTNYIWVCMSYSDFSRVTPEEGVSAKVQIEAGSSSTTFAPYSNICPILGTDKLNMFIEESYDQSATPKVVITLPQTVYTGTIGSDGGESRDAVVDLGTLTWEYQNNYERFRAQLTDYKHPATAEIVANMLCEQYKPVGMNATRNIDVHYANNIIALATAPNNYVYIVNTAYTDPSDLTSALVGCKMVYERDEHQTFPLTAPTIPTPTGTATTWATAEDGTVDGMEVTYVGKA